MDNYLAYVKKFSNLKNDVYKGLEFINWKKYAQKDSTVFIKPNFTFPFYKKGITTHPQLLKNLLEIIRDRVDNVILGESDGGNHAFTAEESFKGHNMFKICKKIGVELINLSKLPSVFVKEKIQGKKVKIQVPKLLLKKVNCFISVPVLKVHALTTVTLSLKNLWGCYPDPKRVLYHKNLSYKIALMTKLIAPKIVVIDGTYALDGHGPIFGTAKKLDLLVVANNPVVADCLGTNMMGIPPKCVQHIVVSEKEGLGTTNLKEITMNNALIKHKTKFYTTKTVNDKAMIPLFHSETLAKVVMNSPFTPLVYKIARVLRSPEEKRIANQLKMNRL